MKNSTVFALSFVSVALCFGLAGAAQDHNSSRSNKTSSVVAPDTGSTDMKAKEKANRTKSMTAGGSQDSSAPESKAFVLPHVLEKSGTINGASAPCDPNTADCGGAAGIAIDEGGTPKVHKKPATIIKDGDPSTTDCDDNDPKRMSGCGGAAGMSIDEAGTSKGHKKPAAIIENGDGGAKNGLQDKKNR